MEILQRLILELNFPTRAIDFRKGVVLAFAVVSMVGMKVFAQHIPPDFVSQPSVEWKFRTSQPILTSPVVDENLVYFGGLDSLFYALEISSARVVWKFRCKGAIRSKAIVDGNRLYLNGGDGNLYCFDKKTGKVNWTFATKGEKKYDFADYHHATPLLDNQVLYFGSGDGNFYAVRADKGTLLWSYATGDVVHSSAAIDGDRIFFGSFDGYVYALQVADGALAWKFKTVGQMYFPKGEVQGSPAVYKGLVIVGARDFNIYAISQKNGTGVWNRYLPNGWGLVNTIHDSVLHVGTGDERRFLSLDPRSGTEYWNKKMEFLVFGSNAYSERMLYVGTTIGKLHGIDLKTGETKWTFATEGYTRNRAKYFQPDDTYRDDIYSIIKSNEQFLEVEFELGGIFSTPAITPERILITTSEGTVYCLHR